MKPARSGETRRVTRGERARSWRRDCWELGKGPRARGVGWPLAEERMGCREPLPVLLPML